VGASLLVTWTIALPGMAAEKGKMPAEPKHAVVKPGVQRLGGPGPWNAYLYKEKSGRVCYLAGGPQKSEPPRFKRKLPAAIVTHRPQENVANVVSFVEGYPLKDGSTASLDIDGTHFELFT
jgi:hypothetical protein